MPKDWIKKTLSKTGVTQQRIEYTPEEKQELVEDQARPFYGKGMRKIKSYHGGTSVAVTSLGNETTQNDANSVQEFDVSSSISAEYVLAQIKTLNIQNVTGIICIQVGDKLHTIHLGQAGHTRAHIVKNKELSEIENSESNVTEISDDHVLIVHSQGVTDKALNKLQTPVTTAKTKENSTIVVDVSSSSAPPAQTQQVFALEQDPMIIATALEDNATSNAGKDTKNITIQVTKLKKLPPNTMQVFAVFDGENLGDAQSAKKELESKIIELKNLKVNDSIENSKEINDKINQIKKEYPHADVKLLNKVIEHVNEGTVASQACMTLLNQVEQEYGDLGKSLKWLVLGVVLTATVTGIILGGWAPLGIIGALSLAEQVLIGFSALCITVGAKIYYEDKKHSLTTPFYSALTTISQNKTDGQLKQTEKLGNN